MSIANVLIKLLTAWDNFWESKIDKKFKFNFQVYFFHGM